MLSAVCIKDFGIYMVPKSKSGILQTMHVQKCFWKLDQHKMICRKKHFYGLYGNMQETLSGWWDGWTFENGQKLEYHVSTITVSEKMLESSSNGSSIGTRCSKLEVIGKCKEINNSKWEIACCSILLWDNVHMSVFTSKPNFSTVSSFQYQT